MAVALLPDKPNKWYCSVDLYGFILNSTVLADENSECGDQGVFIKYPVVVPESPVNAWAYLS